MCGERCDARSAVRLRLVRSVAGTSALAQAPSPLPEPNDAARALVGVWELSNPGPRPQMPAHLPARPGAARTRADASRAACAIAFPDLRATAAWQLARDDSLRLVDKQGTMLLELNEVEAGMYETTPSHTHYFLQTLAAINKERITDDLFGEWQFTARHRARDLPDDPRQHRARYRQLRAHPEARLRSADHALRTGLLALRSRPVRDARRQRPVLALRGEREHIWSRIPACARRSMMTRPPQ